MKTTALLSIFVLAIGLAACDRDRRIGARSDTTISSEVRKELADERLPGTIDVSTLNRTVTLSGSVPTADAKRKAEDVTQRVAGVEHVVNNLRTPMAADAPVAPGAPPGQIPPSPPADMR